MLLFLLACNGEEDKESAAYAAETTWNGGVGALIVESCGGCHQAGSVGPFPLTTYAEAAPMAELLLDAVEDGRMPPWGPAATETCTPRGGFKDDRTLSTEEIELLRAWVEADAPEGEGSVSLTPPDAGLFVMSDADETLYPTSEYTLAGDKDEFVCVSMDPGWTTDRYLTGIQVLPDNDAVVHHVLVYADVDRATESWGDDWRDCFSVDPGSAYMLQVWTPGTTPFVPPEGAGIPVTAGTRIVLQMHYHPNSNAALTDATGIQFRYQEDTPDHYALPVLLGNFATEGYGLEPGPNDENGVEFRIPANVADHTESMHYDIDVPVDLRVFAAGSHMHLLGQDMSIRLQRESVDAGEESDECLIQTPNYDYNWQGLYSFDLAYEDLPVAQTGDRVWMQCTYNNTLDNLGVAQALEEAGLSEPQDVYLGEGTLDEMCLSMIGIMY